MVTMRFMLKELLKYIEYSWISSNVKSWLKYYHLKLINSDKRIDKKSYENYLSD
jgi:hypothetical protein